MAMQAKTWVLRLTLGWMLTTPMSCASRPSAVFKSVVRRLTSRLKRLPPPVSQIDDPCGGGGCCLCG